jgi:TonB family protein
LNLSLKAQSTKYKAQRSKTEDRRPKTKNQVQAISPILFDSKKEKIMTRRWKTFTSLLLSVLMVASTVSVYAQTKQPAPERQMIQRERMPGPEDPHGPPPDNFIFMASEMNSDAKVVKGAPYSAQALTETTQTLSDGNRIVNKSTATIYRDSEGRTRREQTLRVIGPFATSGEAPQTIFINDPVAGVNYALDTRTKTAHKMPPMRFEFKMRSPEGMGQGGSASTGMGAGGGVVMHAGTPPPAPGMAPPQVFERTAPPPEAGVFTAPAPGGPPPGLPGEGPGMVFQRSVTPPPAGEGGMVFQWQGPREENARNESLGKQSIEGIEAEGTRRTVEIPAGEIGNERPIEIVFERWYSPELQVVVMTKHSDPRFGETSYRLTNINRSEPARELFEVPADYTMSAPPGHGMNAGIGGMSGGGISAGGISGGVLNGKAITLPRPEYPAIARQAKASGNVTVEVTIDEDGNVISARSVSGHPLLQAVAVTAARQARFSPTRLNGQAVKVNGVLVYAFPAQ